eukprot:scaffold19780_cov69-Cyclotella_meneghiniana.AAC.1
MTRPMQDHQSLRWPTVMIGTFPTCIPCPQPGLIRKYNASDQLIKRHQPGDEKIHGTNITANENHLGKILERAVFFPRYSQDVVVVK